ncbi:uncharacterized protein LOC123518439 [Portunus trituberculatus]|uniref:uncharacterized protein LOC123518439 n=1 Tax=Portunus trituberculatus TaxID=210409 RepID=UPI001E1CB685|nr:uncharacterized protein LOC123518439 [Portunus trituberculatus]
MGCGAYRWTEIVVATLLGLLATVAAVIGSVTFHQCTENGWIDYWLIFHGVITLGALMGIMMWRQAPIPGRHINALVYLTCFLIFINLGWLLLGNVQIGLAYSFCNGAVSPDVYLGIPLDCSSKLLPFMLSVVIIFDVFYIILLAMLCGQACNWGPDTEEEDTISYPSFWWILVVFVIGCLIIAVIAIAVGATYFNDCYSDDWGTIWLIVYGSAKIGIVILGLFWFRYRPDAFTMWSSPTCYLTLPFFVFFLLLIALWVIGMILSINIREESCLGVAACNDMLQVTEIVIISFFYLITIVIVYYGIIFFLAILFFFGITIVYHCSGELQENEDEVKSVKQQEV